MMRKNVLIIGASGDIGFSIAERLANEGYQLILHYNKNRSRMEQLANLLPEESILAIVQADLTKKEEMNRLLGDLVYEVHNLVFAAGVAHYGLFHESTEEVMDHMLSIHVTAPWVITKGILPEMIQRQSGNIVCISSIWGTFGASFEVLYSTVKGAQNSFIRALAKEVGQSGISVNGVSPGFINTKMNGHLSTEETEAMLSHIAEDRPGRPEEIAHVVQFLLSDQTTYIQGEVIRVDGGWM